MSAIKFDRQARTSVKNKRDVASAQKSRRSVSQDMRARGSYVLERRRPSSEERQSGNKLLNIKWGIPRKSSINILENKRKDSRPLTDKAYQSRKANELVKFLNEIGYHHPIVFSKIMSLSKKDFENIFQFFYNHLDLTYEVKKLDEEAPKILKNIGYPFTVNKSAFVYVARTNFPSLLGVLIWLKDLVQFLRKVDLEKLFDTIGEDKEADVHKILVKYISQCYHSGKDDEDEHNEVYTHIVKENVLKNLAELEKENEEKKNRLASVEKEINEWKYLEQRNTELDTTFKKYEDYLVKMNSHFKNKNDACEKLSNDLKLKEFELKILQEEVSRKQAAYDAQGFDGKKHLNFFELQKKELVEKLDNKRGVVTNLNNKCWESEIEYKKVTEEIIAAAEDSQKLHDKLVESLRVAFKPTLNIKIPQIQNLEDNFHSELPLYEIQQTPHTALYKPFRDTWESIGKRIKNADDILKGTYNSLKQKLTELEMKKSEILMKLKLLSVEKNKVEQESNRKKMVVYDEKSSLEAQCEKIHEILKSIQDEKFKLEKVYREMKEEEKCLLEFKTTKENELKEYLIKQKDIFDYYTRTEREIFEEMQAYGNEIARALEDLDEL